ncbi:MAG: hypothetical protein IJA69_05420 [Clostridia bacterium]|nr:hypothetical protein [Clostridia bacterium]
MKNEKFLCGVYQNTSTALQSIADLFPKVKSANLKKLLKKQEEGYKQINEEIEAVAKEMEINIKDNNFFEKARLWTSINIGTLTDQSARHLGEMMFIGTVMGMVNCYKLLCDYSLCSEKIRNVCQKLAELEEQYFEEFKEYLKC